MLAVPPPLAQRFDDRWRWAAIELAQARREQGEHESGKAHPDECPTPAVALRDDAAKPDPEHAAERHADGVDPDGERPAPSFVVLRDDCLRCRRVARLTESDKPAVDDELTDFT